MDGWSYTDGLTFGTFPKLLWEILSQLGYTQKPQYYYRVSDENGIPECVMQLHIPMFPHREGHRIFLEQGTELWDTCQKLALRALQAYCKEYGSRLDDAPVKKKRRLHY